MNCCFAASLYSLSLTFVGTHPFAPTRCLVGGELCTALTLLAGVPGRLACRLVSPWLLRCCSVTQLCPQSSFSLHHVCAGFGICVQDRSLIVEVSHHFGPTADIQRGSLSRCLAGYSTHPHHHSQGRPHCPGPSNFLRRPVPTTPVRGACIQNASFFCLLFARNPHLL